jgi:hypothetical protein
MHVVDKWKAQLPTKHHLVINRKIELTRELNLRLATIANGNRSICFASTPKPGFTVIEIDITLTSDHHLGISKLCDVIFEIAEAIGVPADQVIIELEDRMEPVRLSLISNPTQSPGSNTVHVPESKRDRVFRERRERAEHLTRQARYKSQRSA